jgi:prophage tail gpP-like protein
MDDELTLSVGGRQLSGWSQVRVTRGIERCPSDFEISMTERYPGESTAFVVQPGDACEVRLGADLVITGYVDRVAYGIGAAQHTVMVVGRSKCADLVDCSAEWPGGQISGADALGIAQKLAQPYGITVSAPGEKGVRVEQFNLMIGETAFEIIERVCRYGALLAYDQPDGNLLLSQAAQVSAASGFTQGQNVQSATMTFSGDQRFAEYRCFMQSMDVLGDIGEGGNLLATATDPGVLRHRARYIVSEAPTGGQDFAQKRATWEANRRIGRSAQLILVADSWRDSAGTLWTPNTLVSLVLPALKCGDEGAALNWLISQVSYRRDFEGTTCELTIMRPEAFLPMPIMQLPTYADIPADLGGSVWGNEIRR